ncbi:tripartite motif-containing protein 44 [Nematolebias whitei]|uniref:tripartite motif-containing protein 44 n=1 Tax=Nematolebias whitei TaxID=451745 RepID=UPI001899DF29|nr:tripartite motif-containing protein 44 [Nematolebias whitei]
MDHKWQPLEGAMGLKQEELPQMDGSCDACEPDEAQPATQVCHTCSFAFCPVHADNHASSTRHMLMPYSHEETQPTSLDTDRDSRTGGQAENEPGGNRAVETCADQGDATLANRGESGDAEDAHSCSPQEVEACEGAENAEAGPEVVGPEEAGKRDTVTVERLRCKEHREEGSLYCKADEQIICVVCAVQGEHKEHEILTLHEAYVWQKMSTEELEEYVNSQFDELRRLVRLEERRTLHLVDLKEAFLTASAAEKIAEITAETEKLQEEMDNITHQLCLLEQAEAVGPAAAAEVLEAVPKPSHRLLNNIEARPRLPEPRANPMDPRDFEDNDSGPSMDHAP